VIEKGESVPCPVDDDGRFTEVVPEFKGTHVKEADKAILAHLKTTGQSAPPRACLDTWTPMQVRLTHLDMRWQAA
jgi:hypothetical protein